MLVFDLLGVIIKKHPASFNKNKLSKIGNETPLTTEKKPH